MNTSTSLEAIVEPFLQKLLNDAIDNRGRAVRAQPRVEELYALYRQQSEVPNSLLDQMKLQRPSPDKVLRLMSKTLPSGADKLFLVPADAPTAVVLRCALEEAPDVRQLTAVLRKEGLLKEAAPTPAEVPV
jgi:hypothetical protein